jgi:hypothetical protein
MRYPKYFVATQDFTLNEPRPPRVRDGLVVELLWRYVDVDKGDLVEYCGEVFTIYRQCKIVGQRMVTALAVRSFLRCGWIKAR